MIGIDTNILVAYVIPEHPDHRTVREQVEHLIVSGHSLVLTSGILAEFIHVVTDPKRFEYPFTIKEALQWAEHWSSSAEVVLVSPDSLANEQWLCWLKEHRLGRKRLTDTLIAATWHSAGVQEVYTLNPSDFKIFNAFVIHSSKPGSKSPPQ